MVDLRRFGVRLAVGIIGLHAVWRGIGYLDAFGYDPDGGQPGGAVAIFTLSGAVGFDWLAWVWILIGLAAVIAAAIGRGYWLAVNVVGMATVAWGLGYLTSWAADLPGADTQRDWVYAGNFLLLGAEILLCARYIRYSWATRGAR